MDQKSDDTNLKKQLEEEDHNDMEQSTNRLPVSDHTVKNNESAAVDRPNTEGEECHINNDDDTTTQEDYLNCNILQTNIDDMEAVDKSMAATTTTTIGTNTNHQSGVTKQCNDVVAVTSHDDEYSKEECKIWMDDNTLQQIISENTDSLETNVDLQHPHKTNSLSTSTTTIVDVTQRKMNSMARRQRRQEEGQEQITLIATQRKMERINRRQNQSQDVKTSNFVNENDYFDYPPDTIPKDDLNSTDFSLLQIEENTTMPGAFPTGGRCGNGSEDHYTVVTIENASNPAPSANQTTSNRDLAPKAELLDEMALRAEILGNVTQAEVVPEVPMSQRYWKAILLVALLVIASVGAAIGLSLKPSPAPYVEKTPLNDFCSGRIPISSMESVVDASTFGATADNVTISDCGFVTPSGVNSQFNPPGTWFSIEGQGLMITLSTCTSSTDVSSSMTVFEGSCDNLVCVTEGAIDYFCQETFVSAGVASFLGEEGKVYSILVYSTAGGRGVIGLNVTEFKGVENDVCSGAMLVVLDEEISGTTAVATAGGTRIDCGIEYSNPDVWYSVIGTGDVLSATACDADFNLFGVSVFGGNCTHLQCVGNDNLDENPCTSVRFLSVIGETYYILLVGYASSLPSDFSLTVNATSADELGNELCNGAQLIDLGVYNTIFGSTVAEGIHHNSIDDTCFFLPTRGNGWYSLIGTGEIVTVNACNIDSNLLGVSVLEGNCTEMKCIGSAQFSQDRCTSVRFVSVNGETYYILLAGYDHQSNDFSFFANASSAGELGNELCSGAELIDLNVKNTVIGSTVNAIHDHSIDDTCIGLSTFPTSGNRWYQVVGNGAVIFASLCGPDTDFDTQLSIYASVDSENSCDSLECLASNDDACDGSASQTSWLAEEGKVYYIRVNGFGDAVGNFTLKLQANTDISSRKSV